MSEESVMLIADFYANCFVALLILAAYVLLCCFRTIRDWMIML